MLEMRRRKMSHDIKIGDVFVESWGYNQTNIDFFQVIRTMPKSVEIIHIAGRPVGTGHATKLTPDVIDNTDGIKGSRKLVQFLDYNRNKIGPREEDMRPFLTMSSFSTAFLWDGESAYHDTIAAGYPGH